MHFAYETPVPQFTDVEDRQLAITLLGSRQTGHIPSEESAQATQMLEHDVINVSSWVTE
jgi:hypothetical protein